jgi:hypothetical protein
MSLLNHIVNLHCHEGNKIFQKCTHEAIEREWMVPGEILYILKSQNIKSINQSTLVMSELSLKRGLICLY